MDLHAIVASLIQSWVDEPKDWRFACAALSVVATCPTYFFYRRVVKYDSVVPTMSTWALWLIMDSAILMGMFAARSVYPQMALYTIGTAWVLIEAYRRDASLGWKSFDSYCLVLVLLALVLWVVADNPTIAIVISSVACSIGTIPLIVNLYRDPRREPIKPWVFVLAGSAFSLAGIRSWDVDHAFTPVLFFSIQAVVLALECRRYLPKSLQR